MYGFLKQIRRRFDFDLIFVPWVFPDGVGSFLIARLLNVTIIIEALGSDIIVFTKSLLRKRLISFVLKRCDRVIAVSSELKKAIVHIGVPEDRIQVVVNGVNSGVFGQIGKIQARKKLQLPFHEKIILFVGNLVPVKGIEYLIDAYAEVAKQQRNVRLVIVGDGYLKEFLVKKAIAHNIEVLFPGKVLS